MTTYKVTGSTSYLGHKPGESFEADLDQEQERRAVARGSIRVVKRKKEEEKDAEEGPAQ